MNERRVRFLFTLFVWSKIQENYLEKYNMHYLRGYEKKFKENADLNSSFNLKNERNLLFDLGYININHALGIDAIFMNNDVFKIPVTDENRIVLSGEDLYNCGYWLEKQKYGSFICQCCGKEIIDKNKNKRGRVRKYCLECAKNLKNEVATENKYCPECAKKIENDLKEKHFCIDCGREIEYDSLTKRIRKRCFICQANLDNEKARKRMKRIRENKECSGLSPETSNPQTLDT